MLLSAGCASLNPSARVASAPGPDGVSTSPIGAAPCLPPGVTEAFFSWPVRAFRPILIQRADDTVVRAAWVLYSKGEAEVAALWGGEELIAVDPNPRSTQPVWFDQGLVEDNGQTMRTDRSRRCTWRQEGSVTARARSR
jgi:hypothetical protein